MPFPQLVQGLVTAGVGNMFADFNDKRQLHQQQHLNNMQLGFNQQMADMNFAQQMKLWEATGYGATVEQMKRAGINPGLLYGMKGGGAGSTNISSGGQGQAPHAPVGGGEFGTALQYALLNAQTENMKADTELKKANADKISGVDTELGHAEIESLAAKTGNTKADTELKYIEGELNRVQLRIANKTEEAAANIIINTADKSLEELRELQLRNDLSEDQYNDKVKLLKAQVGEIAIKNALTKAMTANVTQDTKNKIQEILESDQRIKTMAGNLQIAWDRLSIDSQKWTSEFQDALGENHDWDFIKDMIPSFFIPIGRGMTGANPKPIGGFHKR